jgi:hypothetical protein
VTFGAFLDNETMFVLITPVSFFFFLDANMSLYRYNQGLNLYRSFTCANVSGMINAFGQNCESGRDQGHTQLGLGNMAELCQTAYNQGDTQYYNLLEDRLLVGYEYTATYNLGNNVPYDSSFYRCGANLVRSPLSSSRGLFSQQIFNGIYRWVARGRIFQI